jgi:hypothetical protein
LAEIEAEVERLIAPEIKMEMDTITSRKSELRSQLQVANSPARQDVALMSLETAIMRLSSPLPARPGISRREELNLLVGEALAAYRQYMDYCQIGTTPS